MNHTDLERARASAPITGLSLDGLVQRRERKETRRRLSALAVVVAIGVLAVGSALTVTGGDATPVPSAASDTRATWTMPPGLTVPPGSYVYTHSVSYGGVEGYEVQSWFSPSDGSGRVRESGTKTDEPLDSGTPGQQVPYVQDHKYGVGEMTDGGDPNMDPLDDLSTDPEVLVDQLIERSKQDGASPAALPTVQGSAASTARVALVADVLLHRDNATPELRAALSQVLAGLEGVRMDPATSDPVGRPGWSLTLGTDGGTETWWFDPQSDQLLAKRFRFEGGQLSPVTTISEASGIVSGTHETDLTSSFIPPTTAAP